MMRGVAHWAVAVRKPTAEQLQEDERSVEEAAEGEIEVSTFPLTSSLQRHRALRLPIVRGVVALCESMAIGFRALGISANAQLPPGEAEDDGSEGGVDDNEVKDGQAQGQEISGGVWAGTIVVALVFAIGLFFVIPVALTSLIKGQLHSSVLFWVVEGIVRTAIFLGYMLLLSRLRDLRRVFECHGAEHKTISCSSRPACRSRLRTRSASRGCTRAAAPASCSS